MQVVFNSNVIKVNNSYLNINYIMNVKVKQWLNLSVFQHNNCRESQSHELTLLRKEERTTMLDPT